MSAVFRHELRSYFHSLTAYVFGAFLLAVIGIGAMFYNLEAAVSNFEFVLSFASIIFVVIVPILTMRTMAEERRQRTELLYSLPITTTQVVLGKYLALLVVYLIPLAVVSLYPLLFSQFGEVYLPTSYGSLFAFFLMGAALLAVGMFLSSLTDNQGFAAGIGVAAILLNYYSVSLAEYTSSTATRAQLASMTVDQLAAALLVHGHGIFDRTVRHRAAAGCGDPRPDPERESCLRRDLCADRSTLGRLLCEQQRLRGAAAGYHDEAFVVPAVQ